MAPSARHEAVLSDRATGDSAPDRLRTLRTCRKRRAQRIHFREFAARSPKPLVPSMVTIVKAPRRKARRGRARCSRPRPVRRRTWLAATAVRSGSRRRSRRHARRRQSISAARGWSGLAIMPRSTTTGRRTDHPDRRDVRPREPALFVSVAATPARNIASPCSAPRTR